MLRFFRACPAPEQVVCAPRDVRAEGVPGLDGLLGGPATLAPAGPTLVPNSTQIWNGQNPLRRHFPEKTTNTWVARAIVRVSGARGRYPADAGGVWSWGAVLRVCELPPAKLQRVQQRAPRPHPHVRLLPLAAPPVPASTLALHLHVLDGGLAPPAPPRQQAAPALLRPGPRHLWGQAQTVVVASRVLQPSAQGSRETLPAAEVHHQAGPEAARGHPRTHRCSGEGVVPEPPHEVAPQQGGQAAGRSGAARGQSHPRAPGGGGAAGGRRLDTADGLLGRLGRRHRGGQLRGALGTWGYTFILTCQRHGCQISGGGGGGGCLHS